MWDDVNVHFRVARQVIGDIEPTNSLAIEKMGLSGFRNENTPEIHKLAAVETAISYHRAMPDGVWAVGGLVCAEDGQPFLYPTRGFQLVAAVLALCTRSPLAAKSTDCPCAVQP